MQISTVGVDLTHLLGCGLDHMRMAVSNVGHVIDTVQVLVSILVKHVLTLSTNNFDRVFFEK